LGKRYNISNLNELAEEMRVNGTEEPVAEIQEESYEDLCKTTVDRAEVAAIFAYMIGVSEDVLKKYYEKRYSALLESLNADREATIIRYLCNIRTILMKKFTEVDNRLRYDISNIDRMEYFDKDEIKKLTEWELDLVRPNYRAQDYVYLVTKLIDENIDACIRLFPDSVNFEYIRSAFVPPKYDSKAVMKEEYNKFRSKRLDYPFQRYIYWKPFQYGNILSSDIKLLNVLYGQQGKNFTEWYKYHDASDGTKQSIYDFIRKSKKIVMAVDCENVDPYKLFGVLKNLDKSDLALIDRLVLYDDYHTTIAWDFLGRLIDIPVEHVEVERVTEAKSLVDIRMAVGISSAHYKDEVDSFILCSSDSDFWGLISSIPDARFLVMYEYAKCGVAIREALSRRSIFHCAIDDFYRENAGDLQKIVLKKVLRNYLPGVVGENGWELTKQIYADAYIQATDKEMERFYEKYIKKLRLKMNKEGVFEIVMEE